MNKQNKLSKRRKQLKIIRSSVLAGKTGKEILKELRSQKLGMRTQTLYDEIRSYKGLKPSDKKVKKKTKQQKLRVQDIDFDIIYRMSFIIRDVPLHSRVLARNYLGFRLTAFSYDKKYLEQNEKYLAGKLLELASKYCATRYGLKDITENENWVRYRTKYDMTNIENPVEVAFNEAKRYNNRWIFRVEKDGVEQYNDEGSF